VAEYYFPKTTKVIPKEITIQIIFKTMSFYLRLILFLIINFGALGIGGVLQGEGARSTWYRELVIAPWTPPGWMFGLAWTIIMICFSFFMAYLTKSSDSMTLYALFIIQVILNVIWNPLFFRYHMVSAALLVITGLSVVVGFFLFRYLKTMEWKSLLILPYFIWLIIATSLNTYIQLKN
jgi:benzodiazapine receptor